MNSLQHRTLHDAKKHESKTACQYLGDLSFMLFIHVQYLCHALSTLQGSVMLLVSYYFKRTIKAQMLYKIKDGIFPLNLITAHKFFTNFVKEMHQKAKT